MQPFLRPENLEAMDELILSHALRVEKVYHENADVSVYVIDNFLENYDVLVEYARSIAYFSKVGADGTAYPGVRDRLPRPYERALKKVVKMVYNSEDATIHRCMLSLTNLPESKLSDSQKIPHVDTCIDNQFAAVHYLCDKPHGGTCIYRYLPRDLVRVREQDRDIFKEILRKTRERANEHTGYLIRSTSLFKQELVIQARFNRLVLYPSNLLHCAVLDTPESLLNDVERGRLTVASFFGLQTSTE